MYKTNIFHHDYQFPTDLSLIWWKFILYDYVSLTYIMFFAVTVFLQSAPSPPGSPGQAWNRKDNKLGLYNPPPLSYSPVNKLGLAVPSLGQDFLARTVKYYWSEGGYMYKVYYVKWQVMLYYFCFSPILLN